MLTKDDNRKLLKRVDWRIYRVKPRDNGSEISDVGAEGVEQIAPGFVCGSTSDSAHFTRCSPGFISSSPLATFLSPICVNVINETVPDSGVLNQIATITVKNLPHVMRESRIQDLAAALQS